MQPFKVIIVEDVKLELKGTEEIFRTEIPEAEVLGTAMSESELWPLMRQQTPDLLLLDLGLGGSTTIGVDICRQVRTKYPTMKILIFTGEILNERLWVDVACVVIEIDVEIHPQDGRTAHPQRCASGDGRPPSGLQPTHSGEDCGTLQEERGQ